MELVWDERQGGRANRGRGEGGGDLANNLHNHNRDNWPEFKLFASATAVVELNFVLRNLPCE